MNTTQTTDTVTAALVRNIRLHLVDNGTAPRCAGRRYGSPVVQATASGDVPAELGVERYMARAALRREALANLTATLTDAHRANLCEKCSTGEL